MKDVSVGEVFCEILGGALFLSLLVASFDVGGLIDVRALLAALAPQITLGVVTAGLIVSFLVGLLVDAMGMAVGEVFADDCIHGKRKTNSSTTSGFWKTVPEHVLRYRDIQWTYYSTYRNILLLLFPGLVLFPIIIYRSVGWCWSAGAVILMLFLMWSLWQSARSLITLYYDIPTHF